MGTESNPAKIHLIVTTSWDDGQALDSKLCQVLLQYGIRGTLYVTTNRMSLTTEAVRQLSQRLEIGGHTLDHSRLGRLSAEQVFRQVAEDKARLEEIIGKTVKVLAYPFGHYNHRVKEIVQRAGFAAARTTSYAGFSIPTDRFQWGITLIASNVLSSCSIQSWIKDRVPLKSLWDWETRAKTLFDLALRRGGIYHLVGHSWQVEENREWEKLGRVLDYISGRAEVEYVTNSQALELAGVI